MSTQNWYALNVTLSPELTHWVSKNVDPSKIKEIPTPHITVLYGFEPDRYSEVEEVVKKYDITPDDYSFGEPRRGDVSPVIIVPLKSDKLQRCFWELHSRFPNKHTLIHGMYDPHVTLCWLVNDS